MNIQIFFFFIFFLLLNSVINRSSIESVTSRLYIEGVKRKYRSSGLVIYNIHVKMRYILPIVIGAYLTCYRNDI